MLDVLNINIEALGLPLQCIGLGSYEYSLAFTIFAPFVVAAAVLQNGTRARSASATNHQAEREDLRQTEQARSASAILTMTICVLWLCSLSLCSPWLCSPWLYSLWL